MLLYLHFITILVFAYCKTLAEAVQVLWKMCLPLKNQKKVMAIQKLFDIFQFYFFILIQLFVQFTVLRQLDFEGYKIQTTIIICSVFEPSTPVCKHHGYMLTFSMDTPASVFKHKDWFGVRGSAQSVSQSSVP